MFRSTRTRALLFALAWVAVGCSGAAAPSPTARDLTAVQEALALRGVSIVKAVGGDAGCPGSALHSNAVRLDVRLAADDQERQVYLFRWRRPAHFTAAEAAFGDCARNFARSSATPVETLAVPPWRAYGADWTPGLRETLDAALRAAGGG